MQHTYLLKPRVYFAPVDLARALIVKHTSLNTSGIWEHKRLLPEENYLALVFDFPATGVTEDFGLTTIKKMRSSVDGPPCPLGSRGTNSSSNNNSNSNSSGNSGSQYALCALGVGLIALGVVMIVWSMVPADAAVNGSSTGLEGGAGSGRKNKTSSIAFVLAGSGVAMLLLSICLGMRNKQRERMRLQETRNQRQEATMDQEQRQTAEEQAQRYAVPTYEEAVGSGQYPVRQSNFRPSLCQLPSYDDLVQIDVVQFENEGSEVMTTVSQNVPASNAPSAAVSMSSHRPGRNGRNFLPIKIRRIKSEKLPMKNTGNTQPAVLSIEPLTPPPQYEDKVPPL